MGLGLVLLRVTAPMPRHTSALAHRVSHALEWLDLFDPFHHTIGKAQADKFKGHDPYFYTRHALP